VPLLKALDSLIRSGGNKNLNAPQGNPRLRCRWQIPDRSL
jgi:hypothetical protein